MANWPVNPIGNLFGESYSTFGNYGTDCSAGFNDAGNTQQTVADVNIVFSIGLEYYDHTAFSNVCHFSAELSKVTPTGLQSVDYEYKYLPADQKARNGHWWDTLTVSVTMTDPVENYQLHIHVDIPAGILHTSEDAYINLQAIQGIGVIGDFTLDFVPLTIVYCPPGQDMTSSLSQTTSFGSKYTIGNSSTFQSDTSVSLKVDFLGIIGEGVSFSNSQSVSNQATSGIQVSHFKNTVVTADNQRAIGRAYWGPLNDIFVIMVNPNFQVSQRADGTLLYCMKDVEQLIIVAARKLLRPDTDPIANAIPADSRQRLLQLDPFITNLNLFFPDSGADLAVAADPFADPTVNNRASIIGRWWLDTGTEISYSVGETVQLFTNVTNQVSYQSGVSINASAGVNYNGIAAALGLGAGTTTTVGVQSSSENDAGYAYNAACFLIRNQNDRDLDGIEVYFDKIFSSFMFRRLNAQQIEGGGPGGTATTATTGTSGTAGKEPLPGGKNKVLPPGPNGRGILLGQVTNREGTLLRGLQVYLTGSDGTTYQTSSSAIGKYSFANLASGAYTLVAGDQRSNVTISPECSLFQPQHLDLKNVRRVLDLSTAAVWEVADALGLPSDIVRNIGSQLENIKNEEHVAKAAGADAAMLARWKRNVVFIWPGVSSAHAQARPAAPKKPKPPSHSRGRDAKQRSSHRGRGK